MIRHLHIAGLGPHSDTPLDFPDPYGTTEIRGASMTGKSSALEAVCLCLWGTASNGRPFPVEVIPTNTDRATVEVEMASGTIFRRVLTRDRKHTRVVVRDGEETAYRTEEDWRGALGALGRRVEADGARVDLARVLMTPMSWVPLSAGNARALRDVLGAILPAADLRAEVARLMTEAGHEAKKGDPMDLKLAEDGRKAARTAAAAAAGTLAEARRQLGALSEPIPDAPGGHVAAGRTVDAARAWERFDEADARAAEAEMQRAAVEQAAAAWVAGRAELGDRPAVSSSAFNVALSARVGAERAHERAVEAYRAAERRAEQTGFAAGVAEATVKRLQIAGDACPTCGQDGWRGGAERLQEATDEANRLVDVHNTALADEREAMDALPPLEQALRECALAESDARTALYVAEAAARTWDTRLAALGRQPTAPGLVARPTAPTEPRPTPEQAQAAAALLEEHLRIEGARRQRMIDRANAERAERSATIAADNAAREAKRWDALVEFRRRAPTDIARRQADALGDLGPVSLRWSDEGPAVEVWIDGLPWWAVSTGRLVVADLIFRAALRRAAGLDWLVLFVDRVQDWTEAWPEIDGPVVMLRSAPGPIVVEAFAPSMAAK